jgi:uncharacterized protein
VSGVTRRGAIKLAATAALTARAAKAADDPKKKPRRYRILSLDGGGIRGLLTAYLLRELDRTCDFLKRVDLFAGTSTGGILALGLAGKVKIEDLIKLYSTKAKQIFKRPPPPSDTEMAAIFVGAKAVGKLLKKKNFDVDLAAGASQKLFAVKYISDGLREALEGVFKANPTITKLDRKVLVTTFRLDSERGWSPVVIHNLPGQGQPLIESSVVEAAMCTAAAPTYFAPYKHKKLGYCVDGGMFANNPGSLAVSAAVRADYDIGTIAVLSVGTGGRVSRYPLEKMPISASYLGILPWMWPKASPKYQTPESPLLAALFDGTSASGEMVCDGLLGSRYSRVQVQLREVIELDDTDAVGRLEVIAKEHVKTAEWAATVAWTKDYFGE